MQIELTRWERDCDLRKICRAKAFWWAKKAKLKDGQAVVFTNTMEDRCRMIVLLDGLPWLMAPPVADEQHPVKWIYDMAVQWILGLPTTKTVKYWETLAA